MKLVATFTCGFVLLFSACSKPPKNAATEMANEMCKAMELIKKDDAMSVVEAKAALSSIAKDKKKVQKGYRKGVAAGNEGNLPGRSCKGE